MFVSSRHHRAK